MKRDKRILIVGSVAIDSVVTPYGKRENILGGSATYSSLSASYFNRDTGIVAVVGKDFPKKYYDLLRKKGINLEGFQTAKGSTFRWEGDYRKDIQSPETVYTHLNVFKDFKPRIPENWKTSPFIFLANIDPDLQDTVFSSLKKPKMVLCDTMNYWITQKPAALKKIMKKIDVFLMNDSEARQLSECNNLRKAASYILDKGAKFVVIKKGEHGIICFSKYFEFASPALILDKIMDPTGAGDTFAGGMIGYLSTARKITENTFRKSLIYGNIMASFTVEDFSVNGLKKINDRAVQMRYRTFRSLTKF